MENIRPTSAGRQSPLFGLVLAGGKSSRMGREKAGLSMEPGGVSWAARGLDLLAPFCSGVFLSLRDGQDPPADCAAVPVIRDAPGAAGPLAGLLGAFARVPHAAWLVLACDLPCATAEVISHLLQSRDSSSPFTAYASPLDGQPEPLCAVYEPAAHPVLLARAMSGDYSLRAAMHDSSCTLLELPHERIGALDNMNTPEDLQRMSIR
jgi:molybdenum cofactor guanylyltransferase